MHCFRLAAHMAQLLGETDDARRYRDVREQLTEKVNREEFLDRDRGLYGAGDQGCQALALHEGVVPADLREKVAQNLLRNITEEHDNHLNTGFIGTWYLLRTLTMLERPDVAVKLVANETPPSFASMLHHPDSPEQLTLLPEFHGKGMIPHPGWCSVGSWFYRSLAGIRPDREKPGFRRFVVRPQVTEELDWVKAEHDSIAGTVGVEWKQNNGRVDLSVSVPANSSARVHVPAVGSDSVEAPGDARFVEMVDGRPAYEVDPGTHLFRTL
jgi:alpha-L-rhamnosidase